MLVMELRVERDRGLTRSQSSLVNPIVHLGALLFELVDPGLHVGQLALKLVNLLRVGSNGLVEGLGKQVWHGLGLGGGHCGNLLAPDGHCVVAAVGDALREGGLLGLLGTRVHVSVFSGRGGLLRERLLAVRVLVLFGVVVEGLGTGRGVVLDVAVCSRSALKEHHGKEEAARGREAGVIIWAVWRSEIARQLRNRKVGSEWPEELCALLVVGNSDG